MKGLRQALIIGTLLAIMLMSLMFSAVSAETAVVPAPTPAFACAAEPEVSNVSEVDCCQYGIDNCCWAICCAEQTNWYRVSFFEPVYVYNAEWDIGYWSSEWVTVMIEAHNGDEAAEILGFRAGYDCMVGCAIGYDPAD